MRTVLSLTTAACIALAVSSCSRVEGTNRTQFNLMGDGQMNAMGLEAYQQVKTQEKVSTDAEGQAFITQVGTRICAQAPDRKFQYEFTLLESDSVNAFCLPGGKVAVYTAILPYCQNEAGLAAVLGHEVAHAIARHGAERMSQGVAVQGSQIALATALQLKGVEQTNANLIMAGAGLLGQVGILLPYSRTHELEADYLGLIYMAKAGYDPREAVSFWQRFATLGSGGPTFLSTHPASEDRAQRLNAKMNEALALYNAAPVKHGAGNAVPARYQPATK